MAKIKDIIEKMQANGSEYHSLRLLIAKRVWLIVASLYYLSVLFTAGGFYFAHIGTDDLSMISFHLYSVLVIATVWFFYSLCEYGIAVYMPDRKWVISIPIVLGAVFAIGVLLVHLGILAG